jgi:hypothetical protein
MTAIRPDVIDLPETVPARMVNEFVYCPRLFHLEWVQGRFATNDDVEEGLYVHRRVSTSRSVSFHARAECLANRAPLGPPSGYPELPRMGVLMTFQRSAAIGAGLLAPGVTGVLTRAVSPLMRRVDAVQGSRTLRRTLAFF